MTSSAIRCHYEVLDVERDADAATIKKAHRKQALRLHPDKNLEDEGAADSFRLVQQAYECLSDPMERKWYDEHRDAILKGWSAGGPGEQQDVDILFDITPYMYAGCYNGYDDDTDSFYAIYSHVFQEIYHGEEEGTYQDTGSSTGSTHYLQSAFGSATSPWLDVASFYQSWEAFTSCLNFAWADLFDVKDAPHRRIRRAMEEENRKARRSAKRSRNEDVLALVHFCKRRDPRVKEHKAKAEKDKALKEKQQKVDTILKKKEAKQARELWRQEIGEAMAAAEEEDRERGRVRLADLEDDYDYGGGRKRRGKKGKKKAKEESKDEEETEEDQAGEESPEGTVEAQEGDTDADSAKVESQNGDAEIEIEANTAAAAATDELDTNDDAGSDSDSEAIEAFVPDIYRCECCRKDFKSEGQMENHMKSKKHKDALKKYRKAEHKLMEELLNEADIGE